MSALPSNVDDGQKPDGVRALHMAVCPECLRTVETRSAQCPCSDCQGTIYFIDHWGGNRFCFGSARGVKLQRAHAVEPQPVENTQSSANINEGAD